VLALDPVVPRVEETLERFLAERRADAVAVDPAAAGPLDEIRRLFHAGGKRLRPAFCYWGYRAAGGEDTETIWRVAAAIELVHTMALLHDDVIDDDVSRRGEPAAHVRQATLAAGRGQPDADRIGTGVAIVAGDLAVALADELFATAQIAPDRWPSASSRFQRMRLDLALGAYLDVTRLGADPAAVAYLKGGAYTVEAPVLIGAAVAGEMPDVEHALRRFARPLGAAFQLLDDLADGDASAGATRAQAEVLVSAARAALAELPAPAATALGKLTDLVGSL
jgi:geranylgeranyl diphosphate synthase type I